MSDDPLEKIPLFNRVSIRAVLVQEGEDATAALAEAGIVNPVAIPVMLGEEPDLSAGMLGNGITPNLTAVLETLEDEAPGFSAGTEAPAVGPAANEESPPRSVTAMLAPAFGMQPLAPVRKPGG